MDQSYEDRKKKIIGQMKERSSAPVGLQKDSSNLFRNRTQVQKKSIDVRQMNHVLEVNVEEGWVEAEGMTTYETLVEETLKYGVMPAVVPQLKTITIGGAISGVGIEATSFKYGLVHETVLEMDVLLSDGRVVTCTKNNEYRDLFFGIPNSYGTLGYVIRVKVKAIPVKSFVQVHHQKYTESHEYFRALEEVVRARHYDFVDGVVFGKNEMYITTGTFTDDASRAPSDYTFRQIYYRSIQHKHEDILTAKGYIWRWDTDWFWCSKNLYMQNPIVRTIVGRRYLNSRTYTNIMRWNQQWHVADRIERLRGVHSESVIQDVDIPIDRAADFLAFFQREIGISPLWVCPIRAYKPAEHYALYPIDPKKTYVNFGFWDVIRGKERQPEGYCNRKVEDVVRDLGGIKSLYSSVYYDKETFWRIYNGQAYMELKKKYDPGKMFLDVFEKTVLRK